MNIFTRLLVGSRNPHRFECTINPLVSLPPPPLQNQLLNLAALLKEANAISVELNKHVSFQFAVMSDTPYSPIPFSVATGTDVDVDSGDVRLACALDTPQGVKKCGPMVGVEVTDSKHGATNVWSLCKFK